MNQALAKKDQDLAAAQKAADEKTALAEQKLASVGKLEEENAKLKTIDDEVKKEAAHLKVEKVALAEKVDALSQKRDELEAYLGGLAKKMFLMLEGILSHLTGSKNFFTMLPPTHYFLSVQSYVRISRRRLGGTKWDCSPSTLSSKMKPQ